jgi:hypothetical protein
VIRSRSQSDRNSRRRPPASRSYRNQHITRASPRERVWKEGISRDSPSAHCAALRSAWGDRLRSEIFPFPSYVGEIDGERTEWVTDEISQQSCVDFFNLRGNDLTTRASNGRTKRDSRSRAANHGAGPPRVRSGSSRVEYEGSGGEKNGVFARRPRFRSAATASSATTR